MATTFKFYHDAALTEENTTSNRLPATQDTAGILPAVDEIIYLGSTTTGNRIQAVSGPGVAPIVISVVDAAAGTGAPATEFKLALSSGGLDSATAGASLSLSHTVLSGVANAVPIYTRRVSALSVPGTYTDITLQTNDVIETPVP